MDRSTSFFAATTVVVTVVAIYLWQELRTERTRHQEAGAGVQQAALQSVTPPQSRPVAQEPQPVSAFAQSADPSPAAPAAAEDSVMVSRMCETLKSRMPPLGLSAGLAEDLQLSPAELEQVRGLQARHAGLVTGLPECGDGTPINALEFAAAMRDVLGPVRYEQYQEQQAISTAQMNIDTLRAQVANLGAPLTDDQATKLSEIILVENRRSRQESILRPGSRDARDVLDAHDEELELTRRRFDRILAAARPLLEPRQFGQLEANMQRQVTQTGDMLDQRRKQMEAGGRLEER